MRRWVLYFAASPRERVTMASGSTAAASVTCVMRIVKYSGRTNVTRQAVLDAALAKHLAARKLTVEVPEHALPAIEQRGLFARMLALQARCRELQDSGPIEALTPVVNSVESLLNLVFDSYGKSWHPVYPIEFEYVRAETNTQFANVATPNEVVVTYEMIHDSRVIYLDNRPHVRSKVTQWLGDSRGRWEGETLVVDTTNFTGKSAFSGSIIGRGEGGMLTLDDEAAWSRAWSFKDHGKSYDAVYHREHPPGFRWLHESFGTNWRMTEPQAAIGRVQLRKLPIWSESRRRTNGSPPIPINSQEACVSGWPLPLRFCIVPT